MSDGFKWLLKTGGGGIFESHDISLETTPNSHAVSLALFVYACSDSAMPLLSCACNSESKQKIKLKSRI